MNVSDLSDAELEAIAGGGGLDAFASAAATRIGVRPELARSVIRQESGGRVKAVSPKGARGPMQLMPATAKELGVNPDDPYENILGGLTYLKRQQDAFGGDERLALAAYNAGPGAVRKHGGVPPYAETQKYVSAIAGPDLSQMSDAELEAIAGQAAPPKPAAAPRTAPQKAKPSGMGDFAKNLVGNLPVGTAGMLDAVLNFTPLGGPMRALSGGSPLGLPTLTKPSGDVFTRLTAKQAPKPQTVAGEYGRTLGQMAPNALLPGSALARAANVVLPGVASETAGQLARAAGANPTVENVVRTLGALGGGAAASVRTAPKLAEAPSVATLRDAKNAAYAKVDASGFAFPSKSVQSVAKDIAQTVKEAGGAELYPDATRMANRISSLAKKGDLPLTQLDKLRSQAYEQLMQPGSKEGGMGRMMRDKIDALIDSVDAPDIKAAREANTRYMKVKDVTDRLESADLRAASTYSGGNKQNAVRQQLRPLIDPTSGQRIRNLTADEAKALEAAVKGSPIQNMTRYGSKILTNKFIQAGLAWPSHGIAPTLMEASGLGLRKVGEAQTTKKVDELLRLMAAGGKRPSRAAANDPLMLTPLDRAGLIGLQALLPTLATPSRAPATR